MNGYKLRLMKALNISCYCDFEFVDYHHIL